MSDIPIPDLPEPDEPRSGRERLLARPQSTLTLIIAITAIGLAIWEGLENRRHNRLTVLPRIGAEIDAGSDGEREFVRLGIESNGLGPAVLTAFRIYLDGELQDTTSVGPQTWVPVMERLALGTDSAIDMNAQAFGAGYYLPVGREAIVFEVTRPMRAEGDSAASLMALLDRLAIQICYCSVYESDCGEIPLTTSKEPLQPCPVP